MFWLYVDSTLAIPSCKDNHFICFIFLVAKTRVNLHPRPTVFFIEPRYLPMDTLEAFSRLVVDIVQLEETDTGYPVHHDLARS